MSQISVELKQEIISYAVKFDCNILEPKTWLPKGEFSCLVIITDNLLKKLYGSTLKQVLQDLGYKCFILTIARGEKFKNYESKQKIESKMLRKKCDRYSLILALGGGVIGDLSGFIAATYLRGIAYIQLPTTLLAMIDSSIGGKTAINTFGGKNLVGAIYHPKLVVTDVQMLNSLPQKQLINGLIEAIKIFLTHDAKSYDYLIQHIHAITKGNKKNLIHLIKSAIKLKVNIIANDELEKGERSVLNFGHTIGHALEIVTNYKILHGFAVAYGILVEAAISNLLGLIDDSSLANIKALMANLGIFGSQIKKFPISKIIKATNKDKKMKNGLVHYVLLKEIGAVYCPNHSFTHAVNSKIVAEAFAKIIR